MELSCLQAMTGQAQRAQVPLAAVGAAIAKWQSVIYLPQRTQAFATSQAESIDQPQRSFFTVLGALPGSRYFRMLPIGHVQCPLESMSDTGDDPIQLSTVETTVCTYAAITTEHGLTCIRGTDSDSEVMLACLAAEHRLWMWKRCEASSALRTAIGAARPGVIAWMVGVDVPAM